MFRIEHNAKTNEIKEIQLTAKEIAELEENKIEDEARDRAQLELAEKRVLILTKLGITEEEAKLLLS